MGCGKALILAVPSAVRPRSAPRLWISVRSLSTLSASVRVLADADLDPAQRVEHGGVIAAAVEAADLGQREAGRLAGEEDRDLAGAQRHRGAAGADQLGPGDPEGGRDVLLDLLDRRLRRAGRGLRDELGDQLRVERPGGDRGVGDDPGQGAVQLAHVGVDAAGELGQGVAVALAVGEPGLADQTPQHGQPGGEVGRLDRHRQPPLEAIAKPLGEGRELARRAVGGEDDLAAALIEGVEGVEELFFGVLFALEELDVVDEQDVEVAVAVLEGFAALRPQRVDELVGEATRRSCSGR